jgi:ATP-dependent Clp protease ATP-binding subunit ClpC
LTEAIRRRSYAVILLDEIEKAHPEVFNMLLQIMEDGRLTDGRGRTVDFRNTILIMSGNVGAQQIKREAQVGFRTLSSDEHNEQEAYDRMREKVLGEVKNTFRPEFLNRVDTIVVFRALTRRNVKSIIDIELKRVVAQLHEQEIALELTDAAKDWLVDKGFDPDFGARPLRRVIQNNIEDELAEELLAGNVKAGDRVLADHDGVEDELALTIESAAPEPEELAAATA